MIILGIIEDQAAIREALGTYFGAQPEFRCVLCAALRTASATSLLAERLGSRLNTVRSPIRQVYRKLEGHSKTEIIAKAQTRLA